MDLEMALKSSAPRNEATQINTVESEKHGMTAAWASLIGAFIEWYDFNIFGLASALVFGPLFFPSFSPLAGLLLSFATFATAWVARPFGGIIFGHFGDRIGRKKVLLITLLLMGVSTFAVGLLPTYQTIGIWAPICLVIIRVLQGLSAGGEWGGAAVMAVEHASSTRKGWYGSFPQLGIPLALVASYGISLFSYHESSQYLLSFGWRIPFLASLVIVPLGLYIRVKVFETPEFFAAEKHHEIVRVPIITVLQKHWRAVVRIIFVMGGVNAFFFTFTAYTLSYATTQAGFSRAAVLTVVIIASSVHCVGTMCFGALSDRVGRRRMYVVGLVCLAMAPFPLFMIINLHSIVLYALALSVAFGIGHSCVWSIGAAYCTELFPANVRYTGASLGYQLASLVFGGPLPLIATALASADGGRPWYTAALVSASALVAAFVAYLGTDEQKLAHS